MPCPILPSSRFGITSAANFLCTPTRNARCLHGESGSHHDGGTEHRRDNDFLHSALPISTIMGCSIASPHVSARENSAAETPAQAEALLGPLSQIPTSEEITDCVA